MRARAVLSACATMQDLTGSRASRIPEGWTLRPQLAGAGARLPRAAGALAGSAGADAGALRTRRAEMQQVPSTVATAWGRLVGSPGRGRAGRRAVQRGARGIGGLERDARAKGLQRRSIRPRSSADRSALQPWASGACRRFAPARAGDSAASAVGCVWRGELAPSPNSAAATAEHADEPDLPHAVARGRHRRRGDEGGIGVGLERARQRADRLQDRRDPTASAASRRSGRARTTSADRRCANAPTASAERPRRAPYAPRLELRAEHVGRSRARRRTSGAFSTCSAV